MDLTSNARELLRLVDESHEPVAVSGFFRTIYPVPVTSVDGHHRRYAQWAERQLGLYRDSLTLWQEGLVRVVHPANGERPDLVVATDEGRAALNESRRGQAAGLPDAARGPVSLAKETGAAFVPADPWVTPGPVRPAASVSGGDGPYARPPF